MFKQMPQPMSRPEFERRVDLFTEKLRIGKMEFAMGMDGLIQSLRSLRKLPNGRVDFLSIDEQARNVINTSATAFPRAAQEELRESEHTGRGVPKESENGNNQGITKKKATKKKATKKKATKKKATKKKK